MGRIKISPVAAAAVIGIILIALFLGVSASGYSGVIPGNDMFRSKTDRGYYVFYRLLEELEYRIQFERRYKTPSVSESVIVYLDAPGEGDFDIKELYRWIRNGNTLVLIGTAADTFADSEILEFSAVEDLLILDPALKGGETIQTVASIPEEFFRTQKEGRVLASQSNGVVLGEIILGEGRVLIVSDRCLFDNENMHRLQNALLLDSLFSDFKGVPIYLREKRSAAVYDPSLIREMFSGRLQTVSFHLLFMFLLFLVLSSKRFSRPDNPYGKAKRKITEHIRAVGLFYQNARAFDLIERIDSEYFKTVVCKNKKPGELTEEEFLDSTVEKEVLSQDEIFMRFDKRDSLMNRIRNERKR